MSRPKPRSKRSKISLVRSHSFRSDLDLSDDSGSLHVSIHSGGNSPVNDAKSSHNNGQTGTSPHSTTAVIASSGNNKLRIRNGYSISPYQPLHKGKITESRYVDGEISVTVLTDAGDSINIQSDSLGKNAKLQKRIPSSKMEEKSMELTGFTKSKVRDVGLPFFEESIIEGFSIMAFNTSPEMELYARLMNKDEAIPSRRISSRSTSAAILNSTPPRQRRGTRTSVGRGKKSVTPNPRGRPRTRYNWAVEHPLLHNYAGVNAVTNGSDSEVAVIQPNNDVKDDDKSDSECLGPLHIETAPLPPNASCCRKSEAGTISQCNEPTGNGFRTSNGVGSSTSSTDKAFQLLSPSNMISAAPKIRTSSTAAKRDLFSIAALTAVEEEEEPLPTIKLSQERNQSQMQPSQLPQPSQQQKTQVRQNGHPLTPSQWLERLSTRGTEMVWNKSEGCLSKIAEEELRQLTHLLFTDRVFTEQVARLPAVAQIMAFYQQQQQDQLRHQYQVPSPTPQSFANAPTSGQNSADVGTPQITATDPSASSSNKVFPSLPHPSLPFTPSTSATNVVCVSAPITTTTIVNSSGASFPTPLNSISNTVTASIHPPLLTPPPPFFNSTSAAVVAALAAGLRQPHSVFQGQAQSIPTGHFISPHPTSTAGTSTLPVSNPPPHQLLISNSPHLSTLWSHHQPQRLQTPTSDFSCLMAPSIHAPLPPLTGNPPHARKAAPTIDAVDLTSVAGGGNEIGNTKPSLSVRSFPQPLFGFPNFWTYQRSPVAISPLIQQPQQPVSLNRRLRQLPRFRDLFRTEGVPLNRGATAHLRICYHIMMDKTHGLKSVNPTNPWWYAEPSPHLCQPKPRERLHPSQLPHPQTLSRLPNYEHFIRTALGGGGSGNGVLPALPQHPLAIDLTRSPPPNMAGMTSSVRKTLQPHEIPRSGDLATTAKFFQQQRQQQLQETEAMAVKRRRLLPDGGALVTTPLPPPALQPPQPQLLPLQHYQNGGMRVPLGFPFPPPHFRHPS